MSKSVMKTTTMVNNLRKVLKAVAKSETYTVTNEKGSLVVRNKKGLDMTVDLVEYVGDPEPEELPATVTRKAISDAINAEIESLLGEAPELRNITDAPFNISKLPSDEEEETKTEGQISSLMSFEELFKSMMQSSVLDPRFSDSIGKKSIHTYRNLFMTSLAKSKISSSGAKMVVNITMAMKSRPRIMSFFKSATGMSFKENVEEASAVEEFFRTRTQASTSLEDVLMPTVKIPDSVPEISMLIFIQSKMPAPNKAEEIAREAAIQLWAASIYWNAEVQEMNRAETKRQWDDWGKTSGTKMNRNKSIICFDEEIYLNSANDKILLRTSEGVLDPGDDGYSIEDLTNYVESIMNESSTVARIDADTVTRESAVRVIEAE